MRVLNCNLTSWITSSSTSGSSPPDRNDNLLSTCPRRLSEGLDEFKEPTSHLLGNPDLLSVTWCYCFCLGSGLLTLGRKKVISSLCTPFPSSGIWKGQRGRIPKHKYSFKLKTFGILYSSCQPTPVSCLQNTGKLAGYSPWGHKQSDITEWLSLAHSNFHRTFQELWSKTLGHLTSLLQSCCSSVPLAHCTSVLPATSDGTCRAIERPYLLIPVLG